MKILSLLSYFHPEQMASSHLLDDRNKAFADAGFEMLIYTPTPTRGVTPEQINEYNHQHTEIMYAGKLTVNRFKLFQEGKNPLQRAFRYFLCAYKQYCLGKRVKDADIMLISSTPPIQGAMAALVKKRIKIPIIYILQDIFPDSLVGTGLTQRGSIVWKIGRKIENFTYKHADKIVVISEDFKRNIIAKGVPESKIEVVYNWVDEKQVINVNRKDNILFDRYNLDRDKFYVTYCGNIGLTQNMDMLIEVAQELSSYNDIEFVLIGEGAYKKSVENIISKKGVKNIKLLTFQPYEEISHVFSLGDIGLIISKPGVGENSVPSKTWSIMSAERPVVANFDENEMRHIIEVNKCGIFTKAGEKQPFIDAILKLYNDRKLAREFGLNGRAFILENLTKEIGTAKLINIVKQFKH